jgi:N-acetylglutamate synthase-like GNAT family acetyltransferase
MVHLAVDELNRRYGGENTGLEEPLTDFDSPRGVFIVAREEGHLVGGVALRPLTLEGWCEIKRLWVRPDYRRSGVATGLMNTVVQFARESGYRTVFLETGWAQPEAVAFYKKTGWQQVEVVPEGTANYPDSFRFIQTLN